MSWQAVRVDTNTEAVEFVCDLLISVGADGVQIDEKMGYQSSLIMKKMINYLIFLQTFKRDFNHYQK